MLSAFRLWLYWAFILNIKNFFYCKQEKVMVKNHTSLYNIFFSTSWLQTCGRGGSLLLDVAFSGTLNKILFSFVQNLFTFRRRLRKTTTQVDRIFPEIWTKYKILINRCSLCCQITPMQPKVYANHAPCPLKNKKRVIQQPLVNY